MIIDSSLELALKQVVTASAASTKTVDLTTARNVGVSRQQLFLVLLCTADMTDGSSDSTVTPSLRTSATRDGASPPVLNGTINTLLTGAAFPALTKAGTMQVIPLPPAAYLEYFDVYWTVANGNLTTGSFSAFIVPDTDLQHFYPVGYSIS